jgi:flavin reductase (DIM6/NTAB) family NADH-FMN oxidoreductase RutF
MDVERFKQALGSWASGVTVVTTRVDQRVHGITVSSFTSLSLDPLLVLVCLHRDSTLIPMVRESGRYAVSVLAADQEAVSNRFATPGREPVPRFEEVASFELSTGCPLIEGSVAHLDCEVKDLADGGDHLMAIGRVVDARTDPEKQPLLYFRRGYRSLSL